MWNVFLHKILTQGFYTKHLKNVKATSVTLEKSTSTVDDDLFVYDKILNNKPRIYQTSAKHMSVYM